MITVYDVKTGEPIELNKIDARERVQVGLAVMTKPAPKVEPVENKKYKLPV